MKRFNLFFAFVFTAIFFLSSSVGGQNITQVGTATTATSGGGTIAINKPSGIASGDIMIVSITQSETSTGDDLSNATATFGGWTLVTGSKIGTGQNPEFWATIMYRVATVDDVAAVVTNYQFTLNGQAEGSAGSIIAYRGVAVTGGISGGPFDVAPGSINGLANDNSLTAAAINLTTVKSAVIMFGFIGNDPGINANPNWNTATTPGALTELFDAVSTEDADIEMGAAWGLANSTGATGTGSAALAAAAENGSILLALRPLPATATLTPSGPLAVSAGIPIDLTAAVTNFAGTGNYIFTWTAAGASGLGTNPVSQAGTVNTKMISYALPGIYTVNVSVARSGATTMVTNTVIVNVAIAANLWATSSAGTQIAAFTVIGGTNMAGPNNFFVPTFPGSTTGGLFTAALGRNDKPSQANGYFYWLPNTQTNNGVVEVFGADATGGNTTLIGSIDLTAGNTSLSIVRLGMGPDGTAWMLLGDNSTLYLAKFKPNGLTLNSALPVANQLTIVDANITLVGGSPSTFMNGDICVAGDGNLVVLANDGAGLTQIFTGAPNGSSTVLAKKFDVLNQNSTPFNGNVNGVAFDLQGSLYVSASDGLYYINKNTVNGPAATIAITQIWAGTGLTDLASNFFPTTIITPVTLSSFVVKRLGDNAILTWSTATESNSDHFEVERSYDGFNFTLVGSVQAAGSSNDIRNYQFVDPITAPTSIIYYRLKTVDTDLRFSNSRIVILRPQGIITTNLRVYPNPFADVLNIYIQSSGEATITVRINSILGQTMVDRKINVQGGENNIVLSPELSFLSRGIYVMEIITEEGKTTGKIIKR